MRVWIVLLRMLFNLQDTGADLNKTLYYMDRVGWDCLAAFDI